jgi:hypothetical protein
MVPLASCCDVVMYTAVMKLLGSTVASQHAVTARSRIGLPAIVVGSAGSSMTADEPEDVVDFQRPKLPVRSSSVPSACQAPGPTETV